MAKRITLLVVCVAVLVAGVWFAWRSRTPSSAVVATGPPGASAASAAASTPVSPQAPQPTASRTPVSDYRESLTELKTTIDYSTIDVGQQQARIGTDPRAIATFVQTAIHYQPYRGGLRGSRGALMARAGNSVDRALLLAEMLQAAGHKVRFAEGTLSPAEAERLVRAALPPASPPTPADPRLQEVVDRARRHFMFLGDTLYGAGFRAPEGDAGAWDAAIHDAQQHLWVQLEAGGQWIDVDTSPGVPYGQNIAAATAQQDQPNPALFTRIDIHVDVENVQDGRRDTKTVLQYAARAADLAGVPLGLYHERKADRSTPVLVVGDKLIRGDAFQTPLTVGVEGIAKTPVMNPFDTVEPTGAGRLSAEWLKFAVSGPAGAREATYIIVDTDGPAARQSGAPRNDVTPEAVQLELRALDGFIGVGIATGGVPLELSASIAAGITDPSTDAAPVHLLAMAAFSYHFIRGLLPPTFLKAAPDWYLDSPNVVVARFEGASLDAPARVSFDLALKGYRSLRPPDDPLRRRGPFYDYLADGVLDHTLERWALGADASSTSVGALFETAVKQRIQPRALIPPSRPQPGPPFTPDGQARLAAFVDKGQLAIFPATVPSSWTSASGWWSVDPATGWTEDTSEDGSHRDEIPERSFIDKVVQSRGFKAVCAAGTAAAFAGNFAHGAFGHWLVIGAGGVSALCAALGVLPKPPGGGSPSPPSGGSPPPPPPAPPGGLPPDTFPPTNPAPWWPTE